jgi:hypothetical protein
VADGGEAAGEGEAGREVEGSRGERREKRGERLRERKRREQQVVFFDFFKIEGETAPRQKRIFALAAFGARRLSPPLRGRNGEKRDRGRETWRDSEREREREKTR